MLAMYRLTLFGRHFTEEAMEEEIRIKLKEAIERAEKTAFPDPEEVFDQVYAEPLEEMGL